MLVVGAFAALIAFFRGGTPCLKPLEKQVLDGVVHKLDVDRARRLQERVARINLVQRLDGGREVNVYEMRDGKPVIDGTLRLSEAGGEKVLAEFSLATETGTDNKGKLWLVDGRFFSLEFDKPTEHMLDDRVEKLQVNLIS